MTEYHAPDIDCDLVTLTDGNGDFFDCPNTAGTRWTPHCNQPLGGRPMARSPYAHICQGCSHPAGVHLLAEDGDLRAGPYECADCDCSIAQDSPMTGVTRRRFHELFPDVVDAGPRVEGDGTDG